MEGDQIMLKEKIMTARPADHQSAVFYLGQEGFLFKYQGTYLLIDPYLTDYVDRNCCTDTVIWKRKYQAPITASELDFIDYVFCTHTHFDHADPDTLSVLNQVNQNIKFIVPYALEAPLMSYGIAKERIICMDGDQTLSLGQIQVTAVPAAHEELHFDRKGHYEELGYKLKLGDITVFHAGDCCVYDGLPGRLDKVDIGFLPINGRDHYRLRDDIIGNMDSREAVLLAKNTGIKLLVPMHFDLYEINEVNPAYFVDCLFRLNRSQQFHIFAPGEEYIYEA